MRRHREHAHLHSLQALARFLFKLHTLANVQRPMAVHQQVRLVNKDVGTTVVALDEAVAPHVVPSDHVATHRPTRAVASVRGEAGPGRLPTHKAGAFSVHLELDSE